MGVTRELLGMKTSADSIDANKSGLMLAASVDDEQVCRPPSLYSSPKLTVA